MYLYETEGERVKKKEMKIEEFFIHKIIPLLLQGNASAGS